MKHTHLLKYFSYSKPRARIQSVSSHLAILAAVLTVTGRPAIGYAANLCSGGGVTTIGTVSTTGDNCVLQTGGSLQVNNGGVITTPAITNFGATTSVNNPSSNTVQVTVTGGAINVATGGSVILGSGTLDPAHSGAQSSNNAINLFTNANVQGITNSGSIISYKHDAIEIEGGNGVNGSSTVTGNILNTNNGVITGSHDGIELGYGANLTGNIQNDFGSSVTGYYRDAIAVGQNSIVSGQIINSGLIQNNNGSNGISIYANGANVVGGIVNNASGVINGDNAGVGFYNGGTTTGGFTNYGLISGQSYSVQFLNNGTAFTFDNYGTLQGAANIGENTLNLDGASSRVIGAVTGATATVNVKGAFTSESTFNTRLFNIAQGGTFNMANGVTTSNGFSNAGTLSVDSNYTAPITGNYTQTGTGALQSTIASSSAYGKVTVSGTAALSGNLNANVSGTSGLMAGTTLLSVLHANGGVSGTFSTVTDNSYLFDLLPIYRASDVDLTIVSSGNSITGAVNQTGDRAAQGSARALDNIIASNPGGPIAVALQNVATSNGAVNAANQTLPALAGGASAAMGNTLSSVSRVVQSRIETNRGLSSGDRFYDETRFWVKPFASFADQDSRDGAPGYNADIGGSIIGADTAATDNLRLGLAVAFAHVSLDGKLSTAPSHVRSDLYQLISYGSYNLDALTDINYQADIGLSDNTERRYIGLINQTASSDYNGITAHIGAGIGHTFTVVDDRTHITPSFRADYTNVYSDSYNESGAGALNLAVGHQNDSQFIISADEKMTHRLTDQAQLQANVGLGYDLNADGSSVNAAFAGAPGLSFSTQSADQSRWILRGGVGVVFMVTPQFEISPHYDIEHRSGYDDQTISLKLRAKF